MNLPETLPTARWVKEALGARTGEGFNASIRVVRMPDYRNDAAMLPPSTVAIAAVERSARA